MAKWEISTKDSNDEGAVDKNKEAEDHKESWNKNKIESVILSLDEQLRDEIVKDFSIVEFAPNLIEEFIAFEKLYNTLLPFFKLWLSFGIDLPRFGKTGPSKGLIRS